MVVDYSTVRLDELCRDGGLFCGGRGWRQKAEAGLALLSSFPLLGTAGCSLSRDLLGIIVSPGLRDEPLGFVA